MTTRQAIRRFTLTTVLVLVVVGALGAGVYQTWLRTPPPMPDSIEDAVGLFSSPRYRRLPDTRRAAYVMHVRKLADELPQDQRAALWERLRSEPGLRDATRQAMQDMMVAQARQFVIADAATRTAMLDAFIATSDLRRRNAGPPDDAKRAEVRNRMHQYVQYGDPQNQAYVQEWWKAMRQRRHELGLK